MRDDDRARERAELYGEPDPRPHRRWYAGDGALRNIVGGAVLAAGVVLLLAGGPSVQVLALGLLTLGVLWTIAVLVEAVASRARR